MTKSFRKFHESQWDDDDWNDRDDERLTKEQRLAERRNRKRIKLGEREATFEERGGDDERA